MTEVRIGTLPLEVRLVSVSLWRVSDAVLFDAARDAAALATSRHLASPSNVDAATNLRSAIDSADGFDRAALEVLLAHAPHDLSATHDHE